MAKRHRAWKNITILVSIEVLGNLTKKKHREHASTRVMHCLPFMCSTNDFLIKFLFVFFWLKRCLSLYKTICHGPLVEGRLLQLENDPELDFEGNNSGSGLT